MSTTPKNIVADNVEFYNMFAATYDNQPVAPDLTKRNVAKLREMYPHYDPATTTVLDFACGTGRIAIELLPFVKKVVGVDISPAMIAKFDEKIAAHGVEPGKIVTVCTELKGVPDELGGEKFDVVICALAFHHLPSVNDITRILASFVKPGGALQVINIMKTSDPLPAKASNPEWFSRVVAHEKGLSEEEMREAFNLVGLVDQKFVELDSLEAYGKPMRFFASSGVKKADQ